jgi:2-keto-4-pentenoate hydratase/2-oxohepta-3-ene-1,7-dioic acid hydratase in catechol pathway
MKYIRFKNDLYPNGCLGVIENSIVKLLAGTFFEGNLRETGETVPISSITTFLPPVSPPNIIAIGKNYADHCREFDAVLPSAPIVFIKANSSLIAHNDAIVLPTNYPEQVDFEAELAVVIGNSASYVSEDDAMNYVLGFTCANDISARDVQLKLDTQWARGKSFDTFCPLGPLLNTDISNLNDLHIKLRLNGEIMQNQPVSDMIFSIRKIISYLSAGMTLLPGTVILTGTPSGVGMARKPQRFLHSGDVVEVEIDQIGVLRNRVINKL